ncbi:MAG: FHA domain-containing protein, partial [Candidatus Promineifilaceae bacterium]
WPITQCNIVCRIVKAFTKQWPMLIVILLVILGSIGLNRWVTYRDDRNTGTPTLPDIIQDGEKPSEVDITALAQLPDDAPRRRGRVSQTNPSIEDNWRGFQEVRTRSRPGSHQDVVPQAMSSDGAAAIQPTYDPDPMPIANLGTQRATLTLSQDQAQVIVIDKEEFTLGRDACDLTIDTPLITRKHARILQRNGHYYLEDLQSSNYTFLNDNKIEPHYQMRLKSGDQIGLGKRTRILFKLAESS